MDKSLEKRTKMICWSKSQDKNGPIVYWMSRDQRAFDNYALFAAQQKAQETNSPLIVVFCLQKTFLGAEKRVFDFMIQGLMQVERDLNALNIPFAILQENPTGAIPKFIKRISAQALYTDFSPLKIAIKWRKDITAKITIPFYEVDTHNVIPVWETSNKREFSARTIRPKIHAKLGEYLVDMPKVITQDAKMLNQVQHDTSFEYSLNYSRKIDWKKVYPNLSHPGIPPMARTIGSHGSNHFMGGRLEAESKLKEFIEKKLTKYEALKNDPNEDVLSDLSPYLHFGQISAQRVAVEILKSLGIENFGSFWQSPESNPKSNKAVDSGEARVTHLHASAGSFLEELIVRRELAENFCYHTPNYDTFDAFPAWAKETLNKHRKDERKFLYSKEDFENAKTHDQLWNAAQKEMIKIGKMHGYMRMYWAKKILEWTATPEDALDITIYLNDKYELDGRDPNGYAGIAWSIGGLHDRPWFERPVFGFVRYMNASGAEKKFDVSKYIAKNNII